MRKIFLMFFVLSALVIAGCGQNPQASSASSASSGGNIPSTIAEGNQVIIKDFSFNPGEINVKIGDKVTWINNDNVKHTVTSDSGDELNSELFGNGEKYEHVFNVAGEYNYYCKPHPYMKGKVIVS